MLLLELSCLGDSGISVLGLDGLGWPGPHTLVDVVVWCLHSALSPLARGSLGSVLATACCPSPPHGHGSVTPLRQRVLPVPPSTTAPWQPQPALLGSVPPVPMASPAAEVHERPPSPAGTWRCHKHQMCFPSTFAHSTTSMWKGFI